MGMYTEFVFKASVNSDISDEAMAILEYLFNSGEKPEQKYIPNHEFFLCQRWDDIGSMSSFYHIPWADSRIEDGRIFSRSDLKNYDEEIDKFIDWVSNYVHPIECGDNNTGCVGYYWYEESSEPRLISITDKRFLKED